MELIWSQRGRETSVSRGSWIGENIACWDKERKPELLSLREGEEDKWIKSVQKK